MMVLECHGPRGKTWYHGCVPGLGYFKFLKIMNLELPSSDFSLWQIMKLLIPFRLPEICPFLPPPFVVGCFFFEGGEGG